MVKSKTKHCSASCTSHGTLQRNKYAHQSHSLFCRKGSRPDGSAVRVGGQWWGQRPACAENTAQPCKVRVSAENSRALHIKNRHVCLQRGCVCERVNQMLRNNAGASHPRESGPIREKHFSFRHRAKHVGRHVHHASKPARRPRRAGPTCPAPSGSAPPPRKSTAHPLCCVVNSLASAGSEKRNEMRTQEQEEEEEEEEKRIPN
jgi:hypothetical protein